MAPKKAKNVKVWPKSVCCCDLGWDEMRSEGEPRKATRRHQPPPEADGVQQYLFLGFDQFFCLITGSQERQQEGISPFLRQMLFNNHHCSLFWVLDPIFVLITGRVKNSNKMASASSKHCSKVLESNIFFLKYIHNIINHDNYDKLSLTTSLCNTFHTRNQMTKATWTLFLKLPCTT